MANTKVKSEEKNLVGVSNPGTHFKRDVCYKFDVTVDCMVPYFGEKYNQYEKVQLAKSQVDLDMIIKRARSGDLSVLNVRQAHYGDISNMPDNLNDLNNLYHSIDSNFGSLPKEIKSLFGNDIEVFSKAVASGSYQETINNYFSNLAKAKELKSKEVVKKDGEQ